MLKRESTKRFVTEFKEDECLIYMDLEDTDLFNLQQLKDLKQIKWFKKIKTLTQG